jgi:hypothetical protein
MFFAKSLRVHDDDDAEMILQSTPNHSSGLFQIKNKDVLLNSDIRAIHPTHHNLLCLIISISLNEEYKFGTPRSNWY